MGGSGAGTTGDGAPLQLLTDRVRPAVWAVAGLGAAAVVSASAVAGVWRRDNRIDAWVFSHRSHDSEMLRVANDVLDVAGSPLVATIAVAVAARLVWWRWRHPLTAAVPVVAPAVAVLTADYLLKPWSATVSGRASWPSGTTAFVVAGGGVAVLLLGAHEGRIRWRHTVVPLAAAASVVVCLVLTAYHRASEMVGGAAWGLLLVLLAAALHDAVGPATGSRRRRPRRG